jgi:hypothetical protein
MSWSNGQSTVLPLPSTTPRISHPGRELGTVQGFPADMPAIVGDLIPMPHLIVLLNADISTS